MIDSCKSEFKYDTTYPLVGKESSEKRTFSVTTSDDTYVRQPEIP